MYSDMMSFQAIPSGEGHAASLTIVQPFQMTVDSIQIHIKVTSKVQLVHFQKRCTMHRNIDCRTLEC